MNENIKPTASRGKTLTNGEVFDIIVNDPSYGGKERGENAGDELQVFFPFEGRAQEGCYLIAVKGASSHEEALRAIKEDGHEVVVEDGGRFLQNNKDGKHFRVECYS